MPYWNPVTKRCHDDDSNRFVSSFFCEQWDIEVTYDYRCFTCPHVSPPLSESVTVVWDGPRPTFEDLSELWRSIEEENREREVYVWNPSWDLVFMRG